MAKQLKLPKSFSMRDVLTFLKRSKEREAYIESTKLNNQPISKTNIKAMQLHPQNVQALVTGLIPLNDKADLLILEHDDAFPYFRAGQYINIHLKDGEAALARPISILSSPKEALDGYMAVAIQRNPKGYFAAKAASMIKVGKPIEISAPSGEFYHSSLRDEDHIIACAGGIGITPFLSMARAIAEGSEDFHLSILYAVKTREDAIFYKDLDAICAKTNKVDYRLVVESEGHLITKEDILSFAQDAPYSLFVCGPQSMYGYLDTLAQELHLDRKHYRKELFGSIKDVSALPDYPGSKQESYQIKVHVLDKTYIVNALANEPILYALERIGIASLQRCRGGICGYCRGKIISGEVYIPSFTDGRRQIDKGNGYAHLCATYPLSDGEIEIPAL